MATRADLHDVNGINTYIKGMNASAPDKARILPFLVGDKVLELGCGDGVVLQLMADYMPETTSFQGIDACGRLLHGATKRTYKSNVVLGRANLITDEAIRKYAWEGSATTVVMCSFMHEIYSVMMTEGYSEGDFDRILRKFFNYAEKPKGRIIVRDGVQPPSETVHVKFKNPTVEEKFYRFVDDFQIGFIDFRYHASTGAITINSQFLYEFATKYFYDENWDVEVKEQFGWSTYSEMIQLPNKVPGLELIHNEVYCIPFLDNKWQNDMDMRRVNGEAYHMASTMLMVYEWQ